MSLDFLKSFVTPTATRVVRHLLTVGAGWIGANGSVAEPYVTPIVDGCVAFVLFVGAVGLSYLSDKASAKKG